MFAADVAANHEVLSEKVRSSRVLIVGAAGSVGTAFVRTLVEYRPAALTLVDINENALADLVRSLRSGSGGLPEEFNTSVVGLDSVAFSRFLDEGRPFDAVFNFAALKHVRSERDACSAMRMVDTNVIAVRRLQAALDEAGTARFFSVSSDKAVNPRSLMGATKRWMERVLADPEVRATCTSARFANVAFSTGSLPLAFLSRLRSGEPLAAPDNIDRMFMSEQEAGQLCLLAGFLGGAADSFVPALDEAEASVRMDEVARRVVRFYGWEPEEHPSEASAKDATPGEGGKWPCFFAPANTSGEKPYEELFYEDESVDHERFGHIAVVGLKPAAMDDLSAAVRAISDIRERPRWNKDDIVNAVAMAVPELHHLETHRSLDDRM